jgi:hypothetical protein
MSSSSSASIDLGATRASIGQRLVQAYERAGNFISAGDQSIGTDTTSPNHIRSLLDEVGDLQRILQLLSKHVNENPVLAVPALLDIISECETDLECFESTNISPNSSRGGFGVPTWLSNEKETRKQMARIDQHKSKLNIVLAEMNLSVSQSCNI